MKYRHGEPEAESLAAELRSDEMYLDAKIIADGSVAAIGDLFYTRAVYLGCTRFGYAKRFCFKDRAAADRAYSMLVSEDDILAGADAVRG